MKRICSAAVILIFFALSVSGAGFTIEKLADGVFAAIRTEPASLWFNPNTLIIVGRRFVTVVDTNISAADTREVLGAIRKITKKPVRYVVNTHWHEDHIVGNRVYRDAFPDAEFIAHESTMRDLPTIGAANRKDSIANGPGFAAFLKKTIEAGKNLDGKPITPEERAGYASDASLVERYLSEPIEIVMPTRTFGDLLVLDDGRRKIELRFLGRAHTAADIIVRLPNEKIVACGDLIVDPIPLVGSTSYPLEYAAALSQLMKLEPALIVPGHGPVQRDTVYLRRMTSMLESFKKQAESAYRPGITLEAFRKAIDLSAFAGEFAGDSQHKRFVFENYVTLPATAAAHRQLSATK